MSRTARAGVPVIGIIFLALAILKFLNGDGWVVWALLAFLFGGFGVFSLGRSGGNKS
ncbi:hypothetical protein [Sphingomonas changnyeongensis]|uniref:hypothetical protein n=1 Tax=Sphingomonas changnyeongensis TaxID=2698679 RepID=UPI00191C09DE|nr:hypothetical protein [Sphingomonas changnyeongensis]